MLLSGEIDNPAWLDQFFVLGDKHMPDMNLVGFASSYVGLGVVGKRLAEHQGDTFSHDADFIDGVHQCFSGSFEKIALGVFDHQKYQPGLHNTWGFGTRVPQMVSIFVCSCIL